jgi:hypothetical protein
MAADSLEEGCSVLNILVLCEAFRAHFRLSRLARGKP